MRSAAEPAAMADAAWRRENLGILLFGATDRCVREKVEVVHAAGFRAITDAQLALFHHLDPAGTRLTSLAARAGVTKQSMIELVDRAEAAGLVDRVPDPNDRRAKIVCFTPAGRQLLAALDRGIVAAEAGIVAVMGEDLAAGMKRMLKAYIGADGDAPGARADAARGIDTLARLIALAARRFAHIALGFVHARGHCEVSEVLLALFRNLDFDGTRLTDLAARARMTKQSMRELVDRAEALGLVARAPHDRDRRAKTIRFTPAGLIMLAEMRRGIAEAEAHVAAACGNAFLAALKDRLKHYNGGMG